MPLASQSGSPLSHNGAPRKAMKRSCIACHGRKVRCDKIRPSCANCTRAQVPCEYPSATNSVRRARKATIADIASKLSDLQKSLKTTHPSLPHDLQSSGIGLEDSRSATSDTIVARGSTSTTPSQRIFMNQKLGSDHVFLSSGTSSQYFDEYLLSRVLGEDPDTSSRLTAPPNDVSQAHRHSAFTLGGILSDPLRMSKFIGPSCISKRGAIGLWNTYCVNVEAIIRVLHVPTAEGIVFSAIHDPDSAPKDALALLHAVLFAALISLDDSGVQALVGANRSTALNEAKLRLHQAFSEADFLEHPTVTVLQALAIYLTVLRTQNRGRGIWNLSGLAIRIAQSMGMHRDGSKLGLCPFQIESRRRLWWHLVMRDNRATEDYGFNSSSAIPVFDTEPPLNIEDSDLSKPMMALPEPRSEWTGMTYALVAIRISQAMQQISTTGSSQLDPSQKAQTMRGIMEGLKTQLDAMLQTCNPLIPIQKAALTVSNFVYKKVDLMTRLQTENSDAGHTLPPREEYLVLACECLEGSNQLWEDEIMRHYRWSAASYPQTHLLLYVFWHLCLSPEGPNTDRAWNIALAARDIEWQKQEPNPDRQQSFKFVVVDRLKTRAEHIRASLLARASHQADGAGGQDLPENSVDGLAGYGSEALDFNSAEWEKMAHGIPDWRTLVDDLLCIDPDNFIA